MFSSSGNPFMKEETYRNSSNSPLDAGFITSSERMTVQGAVNKSFILFGLMMLTAAASFVYANPLFLWVGAIGGLIAVLVASFKPHLSATVAPIYALLEGLFVGTITAMYGGAFGGGIIFNAVSLTLGILFAMLFIYKTGIIKVTDKLRMGVVMATVGIALVYLLNIILRAFGMPLPYLHQAGAIGIGISVVIIGIAAFNLLLDFDNFEKGEQFGAPSYMEWFSAMGLLITLVWLYIEILRLLSMLAGRD
ncbi:MAG: Bax inhibitor-1/YccA family protein [Saprospiraceae bacterium]|nr:Bax inhibitor-1/YccA family protein [Saprospiraceae bacterium]